MPTIADINRKNESNRQYLHNKCWQVLYDYIPKIQNYILKINKSTDFEQNIYLDEINVNIKQICKSHNILLNQKPYNYLSSYLNHTKKMSTSKDIINSLQLLINIITAKYNKYNKCV